MTSTNFPGKPFFDKKMIRFLLIALGIVALIVFFTSCSTSHKFKSKDSSTLHKSETGDLQKSDVKKQDDNTILYDDSSFRKESYIDIGFDNSFAKNDQADEPLQTGKTYDTEKVNDYAGAADKIAEKKKSQTYKYQVGDKQISSPVPIKNVRVYDNSSGKVTNVNIKQLSNHDSSGITEKTKVITDSTHTAEVKDKRVKNYLWLLIIAGVLITLGLAYVFSPVFRNWTQLFFAFLRRKKNEQSKTPTI